ncbi:phytanoyl-CoA dioxygenase family protein [Vibrio sp. 99-70-13A1]|uniref:phytanoyl-CoA dioxygenase family protein n=1 Tax=Vibrio sp. 99-70-13A1 TaxID=2607601 RepID=UPI001493D8EE|nr:phytanoyl-CoA dioxygenase family protein [Vibrio sp. 99-70-13A1]NOH97226.1 phytanoyl-CoA dioxygenase family protein [Vibrio sp. 99-70-13A1]
MDKQFYSENGYFLLNDILADKAKILCDEVHTAIRHMAKSIDLNTSTYLESVCRWDGPSAIVDHLTSNVIERLEPIVSEVLGSNIEVVRASIIYKSGEINKATHGHQDSGYWRINQSETYDLSTWIALNDIDSSNGALRILSGSHKHGAEIQSDFLAKDFVDLAISWGESSHTLDMRSGSVAVFSPDLWHASHSCDSGKTRMAFVIRWKAIPSQYVLKDITDTVDTDPDRFGMMNSAKLLERRLKHILGTERFSLPNTLDQLISVVLEHNLTSSFPEPKKANKALRRLQILRLAKIHGGNDLGNGIWEDIRDYVVEVD